MEVRKGYKQTEVGIIPEDWNIEPLGKLTTLMTNGFVGPVTRHYAENDDGVLYIQGYNVEENSFNFHGIKYVTEEFHRAHMKSCLRAGDLLTIQTGEVGLTTIVPDDLVGSNCHALIISRFDKKYTSPHYVSYYLNSKPGRARLRLIETGTTMKHLNVGDVLHFAIPLPPTITEQEAIAEALSDADALIEAVEQLLTKKRQVKQGAMSELLTGKRRLAGFSGEWEVKKLGQLANIQRGASPRPIDSPIWFDENSSVGWVRISDVTKSGMYLHNTTQRLSLLGIQHSRPINRGSLIMTICATVGRPIITEIDTCIHDGFVVFDYLQAEKRFLYYILRFIEDDWSRHGQTGSQMNLNTGLINRTEILMPPTLAEQTAIAEILSDMDAEITVLEEKLVKARQVKAGMMSELLTGKIRLNHD
jgi:type I restriction enzyme S subunit